VRIYERNSARVNIVKWMNGVRNMRWERQNSRVWQFSRRKSRTGRRYLVTLHIEDQWGRVHRCLLGQDSVSTEANQEWEYKILKFRPIREKLNLKEKPIRVVRQNYDMGNWNK
jgi:hypothetical protein